MNTYNSIQGVGVLACLDDSCSAGEALQLDLIHGEGEEGSGRGGQEGEEEKKGVMWNGVSVRVCKMQWELIN